MSMRLGDWLFRNPVFTAISMWVFGLITGLAIGLAAP